MPRFSVVVPAYNAEATLAETLSAVLAQGFADWECVVVDDGSTDGTRAIAERCAREDSRFRVVAQENKGSAGAYNAGVSAARGEYVVLCSADDVLLPEHLLVMDAFIGENEQYAIFSSNGYYLNPDGSRDLVYYQGEVPDSMTLADVAFHCFYSVGAAYRRELFEKVGGYRTEVFGEDYDFWLRTMARGARHRYLPRPLSLHRLSDTQKSADTEASFRSDVRLLTDVRDSAKLSADDLRALDLAIADRRRRIAQLLGASPSATLRRRSRDAAVNLLGARTVRRILKGLRSLFASGRRRGD